MNRPLREGPHPRAPGAAQGGPRARPAALLPRGRRRARPGGADGGPRADHARLEQLPGPDHRPAASSRPRRTRWTTTARGSPGSRFMNGTTPLHLELERELADWTGAEDALVFTTGYQANVGCIATLLEPGDTVICDSGDHASILDAVMMSRARIRPFRHNRLDKLEKMLERSAERRRRRAGGGGRRVLDGGRPGPAARDRGAVPRARRAADGGRGPRRRRARRDRHGRLRGVRRGRRGGPADGHVLQVARLLRRLHRRARPR